MCSENLQNCVEALRQRQLFLQDGDHQVSAEGGPYLGEHGVAAGADKILDPQMSFDPLKEELHAPAQLVEMGDRECWQVEVVGEEDEYEVGFGIAERDASKFFRISGSPFRRTQPHDLIATQTGTAIHGAGLNSIESHASLGSGYEESSNQDENVKPSPVEVPTIHDVEASLLQFKLVKCMNVSAFPISQMNKAGNGPAHVDQRMQLDRSLGGTESCPGKEAQAQIDGGGVQGVNALVEIMTQVFSGVESAGSSDQMLGEISVNAPVSRFIGFGERAPGHGSRQSKMIPAARDSVQAHFDVPQTVALGELGEDQASELSPAVEGSDLIVASITSHASMELLAVNHGQHLREDEGVFVWHSWFSLPVEAVPRKNSKSVTPSLFRNTFTSNIQCISGSSVTGQ